MAEIKITSENFEKEVVNSEKPVIIDLFADWCGPCKMAAPLFAKLSDEYQDVKFCKLNVDDEPALAQFFQASSIPMFVFVKDGTIADAIVGLRTETQMKEFIENNK